MQAFILELAFCGYPVDNFRGSVDKSGKPVDNFLTTFF
jgi:hypothetical protein